MELMIQYFSTSLCVVLLFSSVDTETFKKCQLHFFHNAYGLWKSITNEHPWLNRKYLIFLVQWPTVYDRQHTAGLDSQFAAQKRWYSVCPTHLKLQSFYFCMLSTLCISMSWSFYSNKGYWMDSLCHQILSTCIIHSTSNHMSTKHIHFCTQQDWIGLPSLVRFEVLTLVLLKIQAF
jgi:hypothetical protein